MIVDPFGRDARHYWEWGSVGVRAVGRIDIAMWGASGRRRRAPVVSVGFAHY